MSHNKLMGYEDVDVDGVIYVFRSTFGFLAELAEMSGIDPILIHTRFSNDEGDPKLVLAVLACSIVSISDAKVKPEDREKLCEELINLKGLQESAILCRHILTYAMIGDKKKSQILSMEATQQIIDSLQPSHLKSFRNHLLLWGYVALIFGIYACMNFKLLELLIAYRTG